MVNIRDLAVIIVVALGATWLINRFLPGEQKYQDESSGTFVAVERLQESKPILREIDFFDGKRPSQVQNTEVRTEWGHLVFSTDGGVLDRFGFNRNIGHETQTWYTIFPSAAEDKERRCFLVALSEKTPYYYKLVDQSDNDSETVKLVYEASSDDVLIRKIYNVSKKHHQIDLTLEVVPLRDGVTIEPRLVYPSPIMPGNVGGEVTEESAKINKETAVVVIGPSGSLEKVKCSEFPDHKGWLTPSLFGSEIRFAAHAMVNDVDHFVRRAYTSVGASCLLVNFLEGPSVTEESSWTMRFYLGPKELDALNAVDSRLERTLDYTGWLGPISKLLLRILNWIYDLIPNYGIAIIILTLLMRLVLLPFTIRAERGMKKEAENKKKLDYIQRRYKDDPERLALERAEFIRQHGMPGVGTCLPLLFNIPMFFALSNLLNNAIELHRAPFGWIPDLSAPDPYYLIPLIFVGTMLMRAAMADASKRTMHAVSGIVFGAFSAYMSSGLAIYFAVSTMFDALATTTLKALRIT